MLTAKDITGEAYHHTPGDIDTLHRLAHMLPDAPVIVNIGACFGTSALAMLEARPDAFIFSIDVQVCPMEPEHIRQAGQDTRRVVRVLEPSQEAGKFWPPTSVDLVFVDGAHDYDGVQDDIHYWIHTLKASGIMAFHDYGTPSLPHVARAIDDVFGDKEPLLFVERIRAYRL